ncbi:hypothetical protein [Paraburkholderia atlantica]|uniref:hypothetical protein n=1 Tax=Paraburkholderia atlantica TaxID=2654982 RepID=UPI001608D4D9|nr:hypothetical protein [Paraburkholderia atlantica]MBB5511142.1 hypothetical protein [Paraburkholderia atlantica]
MKFRKIGIQEATTFKGFCSEHDGFFESLDNHGVINFRDLILQIYRCLGSDLFFHLTRRESEIHALGKSFYFNEVYEKSKSFGTTRAIELFYDLMNDFPESLTPLPDEEKLSLEFFSNSIEGKATVLIRRIRFGCQVALQKKFQLHKSGIYFDTFVFMIPSNVGATLIILCPKHEEAEMHNQLVTDLSTLEFIEATMMQDGQWWLSPAVVESWSPEKRALIESDYWAFHERKFLETYDVSIFDEVRRRLCENLPEEMRKKQFAKIDDLPTRMDFFVRQREFSQKNLENRIHINTRFR